MLMKVCSSTMHRVQSREFVEAGWDEKTLIRSGQGERSGEAAATTLSIGWTDQDSEGSMTRGREARDPGGWRGEERPFPGTTVISVSGVTIGHRVGRRPALKRARVFSPDFSRIRKKYQEACDSDSADVMCVFGVIGSASASYSLVAENVGDDASTHDVALDSTIHETLLRRPKS